MKSILFIIPGMLLSTFTYCQSINHSSISFNKNEYNFSLKESKKAITDTTLFKSISVIPLEADIRKHSGGKISRIYFDENTFFILDKGAEIINIYDKEGHHINTIKESGYDSKEYRTLADICVDTVNKELIVLASEPSKILIYSYQGEFLRENHLPTYYESIATDSKFIYLQDNNVVKGENSVTIFSRDLKNEKEVLEQTFQFKGHEVDKYTSCAFGRTLTQDSLIHLTQYFDNKIYTAQKGKVLSEYSMDFKEYTLPDTLLEKKMRPTEFLDICKRNNYISFITEVIENDKYLLFKTNVGLCVCKKEDGTITKYNEVIDSTTGFIINNIRTVGNTNNKMAVVWPISFIKDSQIMTVKESGFHSQTKKSSKQMLEINNNHSAILIIYEF
ncbi:6-bladed beta-propeller [uncultured Bacteroides sp.]|uniref:6-bladed beta-propeller n=1 Tax=uncultured Bacteroides sp. TaxID=162156 RepID=UPI0025FAC486|nr:6-bladed beta-propeller [uncultured Bacteroides sp.]